jgi:hypothetical protein
MIVSLQLELLSSVTVSESESTFLKQLLRLHLLTSSQIPSWNSSSDIPIKPKVSIDFARPPYCYGVRGSVVD